jgi:vitamin B12 transporter
MTSPVIRRSYRRSFPLVFSVLASFSLLLPAPMLAQPAVSLSGVVVDQGGAAIAGARISATGPEESVVQTATADTTGNFTLTGLRPGSYSVQIEMHLFTSTTVMVVVPVSGSLAPLRAVLSAGGYAESVVVTARRVETRLAETPQKVEVIDAADIARSVAADLTDVLKKNAGVDVVQYSGALSGIGIRGFRPQFSGINKRSLLLIDGRPSGVTNLATFLLDDIERIEVLKGAASSVYGSSAMGGVVNIITRQSRGAVGGAGQVGVGSFGASELAARTGGSLSSHLDFDASGNAFDQRDDYRMGNGEVRPATTYKTYSGTVRVGADLGTAWRIDGRVNGYHGRDIMTPGDLFTGINSQGRKNLERSTEDARFTGRVGSHDVAVTAYGASESGHTSNVTTTNPLDQPYLPYLSFENELRWAGFQVKDSWNWSRLNSIVVGVDYEKVTSTSRSYARTGAETAPFSANSNKRTAGLYAENTLKLRGGRTVLAVGARIDRITTGTVETPLKTSFVPSESRANVFNPSLGVKHEFVKGLRGHFTVGRAFVPAEASMLTGFTTTVVSGRTQITQGNPNLKPERSTSFDVGAEWAARSTRLDVTAFRTVVRDRFISNVVISNPLPPDPIVVSVANGLDAHISGLDLEAEHRLGARIGLFANATHYFSRKERLISGAEQDILNVALNTVRAGVDWDLGRVSTRVSGRYVQGRKDNDFNAPGFPIIDYDDFTVIDASASYRIARHHSVMVAINNLFDAFYYEKLGFPLQGASLKLSYRLGF